MTVPCFRIARLRFAARSDATATQSIAIATPSFAAASHRRPLPLRSQTVLCRRAASCFAFLRPRFSCFSYPSPSLSNAKLIFPLPARCPAFPVFSRPVLCHSGLCPRHATLCHAFAPQCNADAQQCHASALRCDALPMHRKSIPRPSVAIRSYASPLLGNALQCPRFANHCLPGANHRPRIAGPSIAVTVLFPAEPPLRLATQSHRRALHRSATAFRRSALPSLVCAHPRPCAALRCPALPSLFWSILRLDSAALGHASPAQCLTLPPPVRASLSHCRAELPFAWAALCFASPVHHFGAPDKSMPVHIRSKRSLANAQPREATPAHLFASSRLAGAHLRSKLVYTAPRMSPASASAPVPRNFA